MHDYSNTKQHNYCVSCGAEITLKATYCKLCAAKQRRIAERPNATKLATEIVNSNFLTVSKKYGVSDNTIRKWCKNYGIPVKKNEINEWLLNHKN